MLADVLTDHDGTTVLSPDVVALRAQLPDWAGHEHSLPTAVPGRRVGRPRPPVHLVLSTGDTVVLDRPVLLGRAPQVSRVASAQMPRLVTVPSPLQDISRTHAEVRMDGDDVVLTDLRSTNGVLVVRPHAAPQRLQPGEATVLQPGRPGRPRRGRDLHRGARRVTPRRQPSAPPDIHGYKVGRLLGMGGFADVFLYTQRLPRREVAVKVLLAEAFDAGVLTRFGTEADLMAQLSHHPSIVTIHEAAVADDGRPYLVMEYCSRPSLGARYRTERISVAEALRIGIRLASAVETAHRAGILHRDIKPANVLTTDFGWPALTDFGIAATTGWSGGSAVGMSIPWSPPELLAEVPTGDVRADVYSLAATIYSLLAGRSPFEVPGGSNGPADLIVRIERERLPGTGRTDVPASLQAALARAMEKNPVHRFHSALAFARALQAVELELMLPGTPVELAADEHEHEHDAAGARSTTPRPGCVRWSASTPTAPRRPPARGRARRRHGAAVRAAAEEAAAATRMRPVTSISPYAVRTPPAGVPVFTSPEPARVDGAGRRRCPSVTRSRRRRPGGGRPPGGRGACWSAPRRRRGGVGAARRRGPRRDRRAGRRRRRGRHSRSRARPPSLATVASPVDVRASRPRTAPWSSPGPTRGRGRRPLRVGRRASRRGRRSGRSSTTPTVIVAAVPASGPASRCPSSAPTAGSPRAPPWGARRDGWHGRGPAGPGARPGAGRAVPGRLPHPAACPPGPGRAPPRRRRSCSRVLALVHPGQAVSQLDLNDGGVWLTNASTLQVGRFSSTVDELNGGLVADVVAVRRPAGRR